MTHDTIDLCTPLQKTVAAITEAMPRDSWPFWFDGWPHDTEAALLDAIFSARATYGSAATGVRKVVTSWRAWRGGSIDDLTSFASISSEELTEVLGNRQRVSGNRISKAEAVRECAAGLVALDIRSADELGALDAAGLDAARAAVVAVPGVGPSSWEVFLGSSGVDTESLDRHAREFIGSARGYEVSGHECERLISDAAVALRVDVAVVRHSIWRYQRRVNQPSRAVSRSGAARG